MKCTRFIQVAAFLSLLMIGAGGCYYEIRDARTGRMYYTERWVAADGYRGPLTFTDHTGHQVRVEHAEVLRIGRDDYRDSTADERPSTPP